MISASRYIFVRTCIVFILAAFVQCTRSGRQPPVEVQIPEKVPTDSSSYLSSSHLFVGVEEDGTYFYFFGGQTECSPIALTALDSILLKHQKTADGVIVMVSPSDGHRNIGALLDRFEYLGVDHFQVSDSHPCD